LTVKVLALDYGSARTGVAVSDPTGTLARPLCTVQGAATDAGLARLGELVRDHDAERVIVGLPLTLRGERGPQAEETMRFVDRLRTVVGVPVETFDERFTTTLAGPGDGDDARAAAHLLSGYLEWSRGRS
jgi:putative transcription antitermination factor YqgF